VTVSVRVIRAGDKAPLESFLSRHPDTTMFLRTGLRAAGLFDPRPPATYAAAFEGAAVVAAAVHAENGNVVLEAPVGLPEIVRTAVGASGRAVTGFLGRWRQTTAARAALGLADAPAQFEKPQELYALDLGRLVVPEALATGRLRCRRPTAAELPLLTEWRAAYRQESLNSPAGPALITSSRQEVERALADGAGWILEDAGHPVAYQQFNARLPDIVQVGGVWTPPDFRGRGYARAVVAGSLLAARAQRAHRAVLFTDDDNVPAQRAYIALGFERVGDYGLVILKQPTHP
jgi:RimJ/RimL family protein N-acetyltransferase